jgi:hypothetical protein
MSDTRNAIATKKAAGALSNILFEDDSHAGFENVKTESLAPPILKLLQNGSAEAKKMNQNYIQFGTGSGRPEQLYPDSSDIISKTTKGPDGKDRLPNGNYVLTVGQHFVIIVGDKSTETAMISMSSSQGKVSRKWNSMMLSITLDGKNGPFTPPSFSHIYKLSTLINTGKGQQWYGWNVEKVGPLQDQALYERAKKFYHSFSNK